MSASTASIRAANPAARRRPVVASEKKTSNNEKLANILGAGGDEKVTSTGNERDLSHHSIRGEAVLERSSKDFVQVKKPVKNSTVLPRRTPKVLSKPEKPGRLTFWCTIAKNFGLFLVLLFLVLNIPAPISRDTVVGTQAGLSEFEGRIAESPMTPMKTTARMIRVQIEVADKMIENEIGDLKKEMNKTIDDQIAILESELKKLEAKSETLERSLGKLKAMDWLSKEEFQKFYDELNKLKVGDFGDATLDEIRTCTREVIWKEIEKHAADGLGRADYALASGGATVVKHSEPYMAGRGSHGFLLFAKNGVHTNADKMLKPSFGEPGQCFALKGSTGFVQIRLSTAIIPEAVTLEHVAKVIPLSACLFLA